MVETDVDKSGRDEGENLGGVRLLVLEKTASISQNQFLVRFIISNTVYKTCFTLRKFNFKLKLRNTEKGLVSQIGHMGI